MAVNMAQKRARKAQRRKQVVAKKQRVEALEQSLPARVARAAKSPIQHCYFSARLFEDGIGTVLLARGASARHVVLGSFLLDVLCLGVKNVMFEQVDNDAFDYYMDVTNAASPVVAVDPCYARKLLRDVVAWSHSLGFAPHRDFSVVERLFGEVRAEDSDAAFQFGCEGKPLYMPGPTDTPALIRWRTEQLQKYLGRDRLGAIA